MKRTFFLLCAVLLVAGSLLPLAGYRLATAALGRAAPEAAESAPEPAASDPAALPAVRLRHCVRPLRCWSDATSK